MGYALSAFKRLLPSFVTGGSYFAPFLLRHKKRTLCGELEKPGSATSMQLINAHCSYINNGRVEAATNAIKENTVPAGHPAFRIRLYDSEKATVANTELMLWTAATIENIAPII